MTPSNRGSWSRRNCVRSLDVRKQLLGRQSSRSSAASRAGAPAGGKRQSEGQSSVTSRCSPQHCGQMRPCTARQKRFSLRTLQMEQLQTGHLGAGESRPKAPIMASFGPTRRCARGAWSSGLPDYDLWKTRMKSGENAFHRDEVGIRYAQVEHFYCSNLQGGFSNGNRHDQDPARPSHGREA